MFKSEVYYGNIPVGEVDVWPKGETDLAWAREIRVDRLSPPSERCPPLAVLHAVAPAGRCLVMESRPTPTATVDEPPPPLIAMHAACLRDNKGHLLIFRNGPSIKYVLSLDATYGLLRPPRDYADSIVKQFKTV